MTARIDEIATDLYRICLYVPDFDLQFNHFLVRDDQPLLFHTGMRGMFPGVHEAVAKLIDPAELRWISWSHFEVDECGALNEWLAVAPQATPVCGETGAMINIADFSQRSPVLMDYVPYTENTKRHLATLAALRPRMLAAMHGSTFVGDGAAALVASGDVIRQVTTGAASAV